MVRLPRVNPGDHLFRLRNLCSPTVALVCMVNANQYGSGLAVGCVWRFDFRFDKLLGGTAALCVSQGLSETICGNATSVPRFKSVCPALFGNKVVLLMDLFVATAQKAFANRCAEDTTRQKVVCETYQWFERNNHCRVYLGSIHYPAWLCWRRVFDVRNARHTLCGSNGQTGTDAFDARCSTNPNLVADRATLLYD